MYFRAFKPLSKSLRNPRPPLNPPLIILFFCHYSHILNSNRSTSQFASQKYMT